MDSWEGGTNRLLCPMKNGFQLVKVESGKRTPAIFDPIVVIKARGGHLAQILNIALMLDVFLCGTEAAKA